MINHHTLVIIRKIGDPRIVEIHDKVEMIKFVDGEWQVVLKDGVVHHYPSVSYVFELIDFGQYAGFRNIEKIIIVPEEDIKKFIIQRTDHEDLVINVNGGTYRDE